MKTNLALVNIKESRFLAGLLTLVGILNIVTDLQVSLKGYIIVFFLLILSKSEPVEEVQDGLVALNMSADKDLIAIKRVYVFNNKNFHKRLYYFNRAVVFILLAGFILHDVLVYLKIIDPV
ncbi:hypothetical protein [Bdellovibrio sp.]|uniref:hypothetical protein n=1 Tax=Bdellovibrio sp. TaxID=28201 RepID=UPI0039E46294